MSEIVLLGSGQVAHHVAIRLSAIKGYHISAIYSRHLDHAQALVDTISRSSSMPSTANSYNSTLATDDLSKLPLEADYYLYALSDNALEEVWEAMPQTTGVWIHTAGSVSIDSIARWHPKSGVLYPLQTFSRQRSINWDNLPIYIEGTDVDTLIAIRSLALTLSNNVSEANSLDRGKLHLAAVLSCNFTNHLIALAEEYLANEGLPPKSLMPLIQEMTQKLEHLPAIDAQTGPAQRGDENTMQRHLALLEAHPSLRDLYLSLSKSIRDLSATRAESKY